MGGGRGQAVRAHPTGLRSLWDVRLQDPGAEAEVFTTWKHRAEGTSRRIIDHIWWSSHSLSPLPPAHTHVRAHTPTHARTRRGLHHPASFARHNR